MEIRKFRSSIIDTSVLLTLYYLDLLSYLNLIYFEVRVPREVEREFLQNNKDEKENSLRFDYLINFYKSNSSWFLPCNEYGSDLVSIYLADKRLDRGEAEVFAQNQSLGLVHELLLDENEGRRVAKNQNIKHHGVLYILAKFDVLFSVCDYFKSVEYLKDINVGRFSPVIVNQVYQNIKQEINNNIT